jgi:hypothetical protein
MPYPRMLNISVVDHFPNDYLLTWGRRPHTPGIYRLFARIKGSREQLVLPRAIPAPELALRSHPCVAVSSTQVLPAYQFHANSILQVLRARTNSAAFPGMVHRKQSGPDSYPARQAGTERARREFQWEVTR